MGEGIKRYTFAVIKISHGNVMYSMVTVVSDILWHV